MCDSLYKNDWQAGLVFSKGTGPQTNLLAPTSFLAHVTHIIYNVLRKKPHFLTYICRIK